MNNSLNTLAFTRIPRVTMSLYPPTRDSPRVLSCKDPHLSQNISVQYASALFICLPAP